MGGLIKKIVISITVMSLLNLTPRQAQADATKEFLMSCTYGVLAGTLVGAATLAFRDKPGDNLRSIARGASIGLYAGILLGVYVIYFVPNAGDAPPEEEPAISPEDQPPPEALEENAFRPVIYPIFSQNFKLEGAGLQLNLLNF